MNFLLLSQLKALGAEGMMRELIHYLDVAEDLFCRNNIYLGTPIYNTALNSLVKSEEVSYNTIFAISFATIMEF